MSRCCCCCCCGSSGCFLYSLSTYSNALYLVCSLRMLLSPSNTYCHCRTLELNGVACLWAMRAAKIRCARTHNTLPAPIKCVSSKPSLRCYMHSQSLEQEKNKQINIRRTQRLYLSNVQLTLALMRSAHMRMITTIGLWSISLTISLGNVSSRIPLIYAYAHSICHRKRGTKYIIQIRHSSKMRCKTSNGPSRV